MATTPEGTPYVESSDLVANYPAASLALANRVDLVGVLPFATSAARATAIPSPTDGQYTYLQDTNLTQFWNGSAWQTAGLTPGLTQVTPTSIAKSGGSSSLSGGAVTFTGVTSISLNGVFSSTYNNYSIVCTFTASTGVNPRLRLRAAATDTTSGYFSRTLLQSTTLSTTSETTFFAIGDARTAVNGFTAQMLGPNLAANSVLTSHHVDSNGSSVGINIQSGYLGDTTQYDGFTFFPNTGNVTGTFRVYGYQN